MDRRRFLFRLGFSSLALFTQRLRLLAQNETGIAHDPDRPEYHFLAPHNWMNDPNGPVYWRGKYHLFYQMNPHAAVWGDMHWGHATSSDMIHWHHQPIALAPTLGGPDSDGCFSGSIVIHNGLPTLVYTGVRKVADTEATIFDAAHNLKEVQLLATPLDDNLRTWKKLEAPILPAPPEGLKISGFRDPCLWQESDAWYLILGSGLRGIGGCALLYRSNDLLKWQYLHPLALGTKNEKSWPTTATDTVDSGEMWECPDFFSLPNANPAQTESHCLLYSTERKTIWSTGSYADHKYTIKQSGLLDHGSFYAPKSFAAADGRRILWGWIPESRPDAECVKAGWAGSMSLPRELTLAADGSLQIVPAVEVDKLRTHPRRITLTSAHAERESLDTLRRELLIPKLTQDQTLTLKIITEGKTLYSLEVNAQTGFIRCGEKQIPLPPSTNSPTLRWFLDGSVIEAFFAGREALTTRLYSLKPAATTLKLSLSGAGKTNATLWQLKAISSNRLTT